MNINLGSPNTTLTLTGEFTRHELEQESYLKLRAKANTHYQLECQQITEINSFFIAWLVGLQRALHQQSSHFTLLNPPATLSHLITLYRLEATLP